MQAKTWIVLTALVLIAGCGKKEAEVAQQKPAETKPAEPEKAAETAPTMTKRPIPKLTGDTVTTASGLKYIDMTVGTGAIPTKGQLVETHYTGWFPNGEQFDSSRDRGQTLSFHLGQESGPGTVIKGWNEGVASMKVGGRRLLVIPPELGWGSRGFPPTIPPDATTIFDVELVSVK